MAATWLLAAAVAAPAAVLPDSAAAEAAVPAGEAMTLRFFKRAQAQGGETAALAGRYADGTLHGMLLLSDSLQQESKPVFCADAVQERLGALALDRLSAGFRAWLADGAVSDADLPDVQEAPLAMFALSYLTASLPCPQEPPGGREAGDMGAVLERALPR
jgi:hypothetical protein